MDILKDEYSRQRNSNMGITKMKEREAIKRRQKLLRDCEVVLAAKHSKGGKQWTMG